MMVEPSRRSRRRRNEPPEFVPPKSDGEKDVGQEEQDEDFHGDNINDSDVESHGEMHSKVREIDESSTPKGARRSGRRNASRSSSPLVTRRRTGASSKGNDDVSSYGESDGENERNSMGKQSPPPPEALTSRSSSPVATRRRGARGSSKASAESNSANEIDNDNDSLPSATRAPPFAKSIHTTTRKRRSKREKAASAPPMDVAIELGNDDVDEEAVKREEVANRTSEKAATSEPENMSENTSSGNDEQLNDVDDASSDNEPLNSLVKRKRQARRPTKEKEIADEGNDQSERSVSKIKSLSSAASSANESEDINSAEADDSSKAISQTAKGKGRKRRSRNQGNKGVIRTSGDEGVDDDGSAPKRSRRKVRPMASGMGTRDVENDESSDERSKETSTIKPATRRRRNRNDRLNEDATTSEGERSNKKLTGERPTTLQGRKRRWKEPAASADVDILAEKNVKDEHQHEAGTENVSLSRENRDSTGSTERHGKFSTVKEAASPIRGPVQILTRLSTTTQNSLSGNRLIAHEKIGRNAKPTEATAENRLYAAHETMSVTQKLDKATDANEGPGSGNSLGMMNNEATRKDRGPIPGVPKMTLDSADDDMISDSVANAKKFPAKGENPTILREIEAIKVNDSSNDRLPVESSTCKQDPNDELPKSMKDRKDCQPNSDTTGKTVSLDVVLKKGKNPDMDDLGAGKSTELEPAMEKPLKEIEVETQDSISSPVMPRPEVSSDRGGVYAESLERPREQFSLNSTMQSGEDFGSESAMTEKRKASSKTQLQAEKLDNGPSRNSESKPSRPEKEPADNMKAGKRQNDRQKGSVSPNEGSVTFDRKAPVEIAHEREEIEGSNKAPKALSTESNYGHSKSLASEVPTGTCKGKHIENAEVPSPPLDESKPGDRECPSASVQVTLVEPGKRAEQKVSGYQTTIAASNEVQSEHRELSPEYTQAVPLASPRSIEKDGEGDRNSLARSPQPRTADQNPSIDATQGALEIARPRHKSGDSIETELKPESKKTPTDVLLGGASIDGNKASIAPSNESKPEEKEFSSAVFQGTPLGTSQRGEIEDGNDTSNAYIKETKSRNECQSPETGRDMFAEAAQQRENNEDDNETPVAESKGSGSENGVQGLDGDNHGHVVAMTEKSRIGNKETSAEILQESQGGEATTTPNGLSFESNEANEMPPTVSARHSKSVGDGPESTTLLARRRRVATAESSSRNEKNEAECLDDESGEHVMKGSLIEEGPLNKDCISREDQGPTASQSRKKDIQTYAGRTDLAVNNSDVCLNRKESPPVAPHKQGLESTKMELTTLPKVTVTNFGTEEGTSSQQGSTASMKEYKSDGHVQDIPQRAIGDAAMATGSVSLIYTEQTKPIIVGDIKPGSNQGSQSDSITGPKLLVGKDQQAVGEQTPNAETRQSVRQGLSLQQEADTTRSVDNQSLGDIRSIDIYSSGRKDQIVQSDIPAYTRQERALHLPSDSSQERRSNDVPFQQNTYAVVSRGEMESCNKSKATGLSDKASVVAGETIGGGRLNAHGQIVSTVQHPLPPASQKSSKWAGASKSGSDQEVSQANDPGQDNFLSSLSNHIGQDVFGNKIDDVKAETLVAQRGEVKTEATQKPSEGMSQKPSSEHLGMEKATEAKFQSMLSPIVRPLGSNQSTATITYGPTFDSTGIRAKKPTQLQFGAFSVNEKDSLSSVPSEGNPRGPSVEGEKPVSSAITLHTPPGTSSLLKTDGTTSNPASSAQRTHSTVLKAGEALKVQPAVNKQSVEFHVGAEASMNTEDVEKTEVIRSDGVISKSLAPGKGHDLLPTGFKYEIRFGPQSFPVQFSRKISAKSKPSKLDDDKLRRIKALLYSVGGKVHKGWGFERIFSEYWDAIALRLSDRLSSHASDRCQEVIENFLKTPRLRRLHNKFILRIMKRATRDIASYDCISTILPRNWVNCAKVPLEPSEAQRPQEVRPGLMRRMLPVDETVYQELWCDKNIDNSTYAKPTELSSCNLPGAMKVDPLVRKITDSENLQPSELAIWLISVAMKEHTTALLKAAVSLKEATQAGKLAAQPVKFPNPLASALKPAPSGVDQTRIATPGFAPKRLSALDIYAASCSMPCGKISSIGGTISRMALERSLHASFDHLPEVPRGDFALVHNFITGQILSEAQTRKLHRSDANERQAKEVGSLSDVPETLTNQKESFVVPPPASAAAVPQTHSVPRPQATAPPTIAQPVPPASNPQENTDGKATEEAQSRGLGRKDLGAMLQRTSSISSSDQKCTPEAGESTSIVANPPMEETSTVAITSAVGKFPASVTQSAQNEESKVAENDDGSTGGQRRGMGFGTKNLAAMRARATHKDP